jgi:DNA-binding winged helix-turn-helix (wHTH) protein/tetratricopeptide (TPR) repeat protein
VNDNGTELLKQKPFLLLLCLVKNPQQILSKDFLLKEVWNDRFVSDNTIAQTVGQLRQLIEVDSKNPELIITHRGRGLSFTPDVTVVEFEETKNTDNNGVQNKYLPLTALIIALVLIGSYFIFSQIVTRNAVTITKPNLLILSSKQAVINSASDDWLQNSAPQIFSGLIEQNYSGKVDFEKLDSSVDLNEYLDKQWQINPLLNMVTTDLSQDEFGYVMTIDFTDHNQVKQSQRFSANTLKAVVSAATKWLEVEIDTQLPLYSEYLPVDDGVVELYMRGLAADNNNDYDKAGQYYELSLTENPAFHLARLKLAGIKKQQGKMDEALVLLDTLEHSPLNEKYQLQMVEIRGYIYDVQGRYEEAKTLFKDALLKYEHMPAHLLNPIRFELSFIYTRLNQLDQAEIQLDQILQAETKKSDPLMYADALHKKASVLQSLGQTQQAEELATESLSSYLNSGKLLGAAKVHSLLARIHTLKSNYEQAKYHLYETLSITKNLGYQLGTGASINELVYILLREGAFDEAEKLTLEMQDIAIEIEYTHMLIAAKQHAATLAIGRKDWLLAEQYLQQQLDLAASSNNQAALMTGHFLQLEYLVAKGSSEGAPPILAWLEERVEPELNSRQHIALELRRAQFKLIDGQKQDAIELLIIVKDLTEAIEDNETLVEVNNILAGVYLADNPARALTIIKQNQELNALAYPNLLILSKVLKANNLLTQSLTAAIDCKSKSGQRWTREDEAYLSQLRLQLK